ncbi:MAG TPA: roadblock/LC7 domain-containing protein [Streptosporangiaceae bacterium]|nr:roadblock/LC7 domain-containing protein [Streptosporangiaceae bacterium]
MSQPRLDWLVTDFTERVAHVAHAIVVSTDGVTLARSAGIPEDRAGQLAAITCGLSSLMDGAARLFDAGTPIQALVEMHGGLMLIKSVSNAAVLAALAAPECDMDQVAYEMTVLVEEVGEALTPPTRVGSA